MSRPVALGLLVVSLAFPFVACGGDEDFTANPPDSAGGSSGSSGQGGQAGAEGGAAGAVGTISGSSGDSGSGNVGGTDGGAAGSTAGGAGTEGGSAGTTGGSAGGGGTFSGTGKYCGATKEELPSISKCDDPAPSECAKAMCAVTGASAPADCKQALLDCYADADCNKTISCGGVCRAQNPGTDPTATCVDLVGSSFPLANAYKTCANKLTACGGDGSYNP